MIVELTGDAERAINAILASGKFVSAEEVILKMVAEWKPQREWSSQSAIPQLPNRIGLEELVASQKILPCKDAASLATSLWPSDESTDEFLGFLKASRHDHGDASTL